GVVLCRLGWVAANQSSRLLPAPLCQQLLHHFQGDSQGVGRTAGIRQTKRNVPVPVPLEVFSALERKDRRTSEPIPLPCTFRFVEALLRVELLLDAIKDDPVVEFDPTMFPESSAERFTVHIDGVVFLGLLWSEQDQELDRPRKAVAWKPQLRHRQL